MKSLSSRARIAFAISSSPPHRPRGVACSTERASSDEVADRAALALGESRIPAAFGKLREAWERTVRPSVRRTLLLALALLRRDEALEFLMNRLEEDTERVASDALAALALYARDDSVRDRIDKILTKRKSAALRAVFEKEFKR